MSITDELREYVQGWRETPNLMDDLDAGDIDGLLGDFEHIADRIDAEHERLMQEQPYTIDMVPMTDENMAKHGWVRLPKDADGEYIRVGDKVTLYDRRVYEVGTILFHKDNVSVSYRGESGCGCDSANNFHHYHAPTVEEVLHELVGKALCVSDIMGEDELVTEYAAKLRLAEEDA